VRSRLLAATFLVVGGLGVVTASKCRRSAHVADNTDGLENGRIKPTPPSSNQTTTRIELTPFWLRYYEDKNMLEFPAEMGKDEAGVFYIVYLPGPSKWRFEMPAWARERRKEIVGTIRRLTSGRRIKWRED
jgi:hypothetical protein